MSVDAVRAERAATVRQQARYASEDATRPMTVGHYTLAKVSLQEAIGLLHYADDIERGEK
mgnify:CR=1 FL=1